jgi:HSP20 family protein
MAIERWRPGRGLIPWRPFRELEEMERRFEDILGRPFLSSVWRRLPIEERGWAPAIDVFEKEDKFVVKAELPGMKEEDIDISVVGDTLTIKGERKAETEVKEEDYYCCERSYGSFSRSLAVPPNVDAKKIEASFEDGILEISLPKAPEVKPKKVTIAAKKKDKDSK